MKKTYIIPMVDIIKPCNETVLFSTSVESGGEGSSEHPVESKESSFSAWDDGDASDINWESDK